MNMKLNTERLPILFFSILLIVTLVSLLVGNGLQPGPVSAAPLLDGTPIFLPAISVSSQTAPAAPVIHTFTANPGTISPGGTSTLSWQVTGASTLSISPAVGVVTGTSVVVQPATRTEYTLTATNAAGTATARTTVDLFSGGGGGETGALWLPFTTTNDGVLHTQGTNLAVDPQGGIHVAYAVRTGLDNDQRPAYYAYCPSNCTSSQQWTRVGLVPGSNNWVADVRVALDPMGRPRLMIFSHPIEDAGLNQYTYAACNQNCTDSASWTLTPILTARLLDPSRWNYVFNYFALDPQGHPAFIYTDGSQGIDHNGTFYATCRAASTDACTNVANWSEFKLSPYWLGTPSLAFSPSGQPRAALYFFHDGDDEIIMRLLYAACDTDCMSVDNWSAIFIADLHGTSRFSLAVDSQGRPRMVFYSGQYPDPAYQASKLYYLWCNSGCTDKQQNNWQARDLGLTTYDGMDADLALDAAGRPRIAYDKIGGGLGYTWCNEGCESTLGVWQQHEVESANVLENNYPVAPIRRCTISTWITGEQPILALDPAGHPRIGYVTKHAYGGTNLDRPGELCPTFTDIVLARFAQLPQP
jgi:hypothetical protein